MEIFSHEYMVFKCLQTQPSDLSAIKDLEDNIIVNLDIQLPNIHDKVEDNKQIPLWEEKTVWKSFFDENVNNSNIFILFTILFFLFFLHFADVISIATKYDWRKN